MRHTHTQNSQRTHINTHNTKVKQQTTNTETTKNITKTNTQQFHSNEKKRVKKTNTYNIITQKTNPATHTYKQTQNTHQHISHKQKKTSYI